MPVDSLKTSSRKKNPDYIPRGMNVLQEIYYEMRLFGAVSQLIYQIVQQYYTEESGRKLTSAV